ncbi:hypothetical protein B0H65DRAFT_476726 [Neurospora tetraspora]|uniref:Thiaminase-2/PQQC domain-containing protein n=1 Tax=Neurospora tetraspora TaxID=94610 RepID=A0AAE0JA87_9PEZI|nr:hypothetical protein B0H65DRAFT_476726 [Neurospora tetraspora]
MASSTAQSGPTRAPFEPPVPTPQTELKQPPKRPKWCLTEHLLTTYGYEFQAATQHPFLVAAAKGELPKDVLSRWLANDRLYIHSYIRAAGKLLSTIDLPQKIPAPRQDGSEPEPEQWETQLVDWLIEALGAVRREERMFIEVAERYGLTIDLTSPAATANSVSTSTSTSVEHHLHAPAANVLTIPDDQKLPGLLQICELFSTIIPGPIPIAPARGLVVAVSADKSSPDNPPSTPDPDQTAKASETEKDKEPQPDNKDEPEEPPVHPPPALPWLEGALTFYGTELAYLAAWSYAKSLQNKYSADATSRSAGTQGQGSSSSNTAPGALDKYTTPPHTFTTTTPATSPAPTREALSAFSSPHVSIQPFQPPPPPNSASGDRSAPGKQDADGGALRNEFIPNWSSVEFALFVNRLGRIIDGAVSELLEAAGGEGPVANAAKGAILRRVEGRWKSLMVAEASFWPEV